MYQYIVEAYKKTSSISETVKITGANTVRVRRVLITENLWCSERSNQIKKLHDEGKKAGQIAEILGLKLKLVQNYLPYDRGEYNEDRSCDSKRSKRYRTRKIMAANSNKRVKNEISFGFVCMNERVNLTYINDPNYIMDQNLAKLSANQDKITVLGGTSNGPWETKALLMNFELELEEGCLSTLMTYGKAKKGIIREAAIPLDMPLHNLHFVIQRMFGWRNTHAHCFRLENTEEKLIDLMNNDIYRFPSNNYEALYFDDDYEGEESVYSWLRTKYIGPYIYKGYLELPEYNREITDHFMKEIYPLIPGDKEETKDMQPYFNGKLGEIRETISVLELKTITDSILYLYDKKDGWRVNISLTDDVVELPNCCPRCFKCDGLPVCDDIGGIRGYCQKLKEIKTPRVDYEEEQYSIADYERIKLHNKGWTGKRKKPKDIL